MNDMSAKLVLIWALGGIFLTAGICILGNLERTIGVSELSYWFAIVVSFVLFLLTGLCWISVAVATREH